MSNTTSKVITTKAGEALIAKMQAENKVLVIDKFVFANVPNRPDFPQREDIVPTADVVHESTVHEQGRLTENSVIYSTTLASDVGPFTFNWSGLYCTEHNTLVAINYPPAIDKTVDGPGVTGNTLVRSFVLEYKGIAETTNITVDPESWQYNAHKRMGKMDNDTSQTIIDQNGKDWFIEDGFIVTPQSTAYNIKAGAGYVSGNRIALEFDRIVQVPDKPSFIYVDAWREGTPTGEWLTKFNFVVSADEKDDYTDGQGVKHFVSKIAQVLADGSVSDLRQKDANKTYANRSSHDAVEQSSDLRIYPNDDLNTYLIEGDLVPANTQAIKVLNNDRIEIHYVDYNIKTDLVIELLDLDSERIKFKYLEGLVVLKKIPVYKLSKAAESVALSLTERFDLSIPIQNFGAIAGSDCTEAIEKAKIFGANFNVFIEFPDVGLPYIVSSTISPITKMKWKGNGEIKLADGANCPIIKNAESPVVEIEDIEMHDLVINGNRENQTVGIKGNNGVDICYLKDFNFARLKVKHCGTPEKQANQSNNAIGFGLHECCDGTVSDLYLSDNQHYNMQLWECDNINVGSVVSKNPGSHCFGGAGNTNIHWSSCQGYIDDEDSKFEYHDDSPGQGMWFRNFEGCPVTGALMVRNGIPVTIEGAGVQFGDEPKLPDVLQSPRMQKRMPNGSRHENKDNPCSGVVRGFTFGWYAYSGKTERLNLKGAHSINCKYGAMTTSGRMIIDGFESDGCEFAVHAEGRDHKLNGLELRNTGRRPLFIRGVRAVGSNIKIEEWGTQGRDHGICLHEYADDCVLSSVSLHNSDPVNRVADGLYIGEHARRLSVSGNLGGLSIRANNKYDHNIQVINYSVDPGDRFKLPQSAGAVFEWTDSTGRRRYKSTPANSDLDGYLYAIN